MKKFETGRCVITSGVADTISRNPLFAREVKASFDKHVMGDWGDLSDEDKKANEDALIYEDRIFSAYDTTEGRLYVITEWDRSYTTLMFSSEY